MCFENNMAGTILRHLSVLKFSWIILFFGVLLPTQPKLLRAVPGAKALVTGASGNYKWLESSAARTLLRHISV